jgi:acetoin utilization deacetylase AcuC-like enzyme
MIIFHDPSCAEYHRTGDPERPERITRSVPLLKERHPDWSWMDPAPATDEQLLRAHTAEHVRLVANPGGDFDGDTPAHHHIDKYARAAAGAAVAAAGRALSGEKSFSLMRPPGHHATRDRAMGFCYFNNIAVAALAALAQGAQRVAIWDFDAHHGNGTEDIVTGNERIVFASIHQYPGYPGTGVQSHANVENYPVAPYSARDIHMHAMEEALQNLLGARPDLLLISAGFDAYVSDPITQMSLEQEDFATLGRWLAELKIPTAAILEGGYSNDLPELIDAFLSDWESLATDSHQMKHRFEG